MNGPVCTSVAGQSSMRWKGGFHFGIPVSIWWCLTAVTFTTTHVPRWIKINFFQLMPKGRRGAPKNSCYLADLEMQLRTDHNELFGCKMGSPDFHAPWLLLVKRSTYVTSVRDQNWLRSCVVRLARSHRIQCKILVAAFCQCPSFRDYEAEMDINGKFPFQEAQMCRMWLEAT